MAQDNTVNDPNPASPPRPSFRTEEVPATEASQKPDEYGFENSLAGQQPSSDNPLQSVMEPQTAVPTQPPVPANPAVIKKGPPKILKVLLIVMLVLGVLSAAAVFLKDKIKPGQIGSGGTGFGNKGELIWWGLEEDASIYQPLIQDYQSKNPNVKITYKKQSAQDYRERLMSALAGGKTENPDIFEIHNSWAPMFNSFLYPLPSNIMSQDEFSKTFYPVIVNDLKRKDGVIAMPLQYDAITLFINEDIFINAAAAPPTTWNEFRPLASQLTVQRGDVSAMQAGAALGVTNNIDYWPEIVGLMIYQNQTSPAKINDQKAVDAMTYFQKFYLEDSDWNKDLPSSTTVFANGRLAMYFGPAASIDEIVAKNPNLNFRTVPVPQLQKNTPQDPDFTYATYWAQGVWNKSVNKDLAWDFLHFLSTPESLIRLNQARKANNKSERVYPRMDMAPMQVRDRMLGSILELAMSAKSWFLDDKTNDGDTGINSQINTIYAGLLETNPTKENASASLIELDKVLNKYGIVK